MEKTELMSKLYTVRDQDCQENVACQGEKKRVSRQGETTMNRERHRAEWAPEDYHQTDKQKLNEKICSTVYYDEPIKKMHDN